MINIFLAILAIFTIYYIYFITRVRIGLSLLHPSKRLINYPKVSVVIAARNEEKSIGLSLDSILQQTYPSDKYEIIVVNDHSTDRTNSIVQSYSYKSNQVRLITLSDGDKQTSGNKLLALTKGIEQASGEIILTTDADCTVKSRWIELMVAHFENDIVFVAGPVIEKNPESFFSKIEQLEFLGLITTAAGLIGSRRPIICNGANLAYKKSTFLTIAEYFKDVSSNDDETLMNKVSYRKLGEITFAIDSDTLVTTHSSNTVFSFLVQRMRWANKRGHYEDKSILITLVSLYFFFFSLFSLVVFIPFESKLILPLSITLLGKIIVDFFTLRTGARMLQQHISLPHFLIAELLHVPYIVITAALGQIASIYWKGRRIQK